MRDTTSKTPPASLFFTQKASSPLGFPFIFLLSSFFLSSFLFFLPLSTFVFLFYILTSCFFPGSCWLWIAPFSQTHTSPTLPLQSLLAQQDCGMPKLSLTWETETAPQAALSWKQCNLQKEQHRTHHCAVFWAINVTSIIKGTPDCHVLMTHRMSADIKE